MNRRPISQWIFSIALVLGTILLGPVRIAHAQQHKVCYDCHKEAQTKFSRKYQHDPVAKQDCEACHARHGFSNVLVLKKDGKDLCLGCHTGFDSTVASGAIVHPAVKEGLCTTCHDPHASDRPGLIREVDGDLACFVCHDEMLDSTGLSKEHKPFADRNCGECHVKHSGSQPGLLVAPQEELCARCHDAGKTAQSHQAKNLVTAGLHCTSCHDPHRSTEPKLVSQHVHPPVAAGMCDACHTGQPVPPSQIGAADSTWEGCKGCHENIAAKLQLANAHAPAAAGECFQCHSGHSSKHDHLLKGGVAELCQKCHEDMTAAVLSKMPSVHKPVMEGQCQSCHDPHGSAEKNLLVKSGDALCTSCHSGDKFTHSQHLTTAGLACLDCHDPHAGKEAMLLKQTTQATCANCHKPDLNPTFMAHDPVKKGECALCHDPHAGTGKSLLAEPPQLCFNCHQNIARFVNAEFKHDVVSDCLACHGSHQAPEDKLLLKKGSALCADCHDVLPAAASTSVHEPFAKGDCAGCHNPHGSQIEHLLGPRRQSISTPVGPVTTYPKLDSTSVSLCITCHKEQIESWRARPIQHLPAANGECNDCHVPHQSEFGHLLSKPTSQICQGCHELASIPSEPHRGINLASADCAQCHDPHASDKKGLLKIKSHPPFAEGNCDACHEGTGSVTLTEPQPTLCLNCHEDLSAQLALKTVHPPAQEGKCTACHNPHTSNEDGLLVTSRGNLCKTCHEKEKGKTVHAPYERGECQKCHEPHGSDSPALLTKQVNALCLGCHTDLAARLKGAHQHAAIDQGCTSCHTGHATDNDALLKAPPVELCGRCHDLKTDRWRAAHATGGVSGTGGNCMSCHDPHVAPSASVALLKKTQHPPFQARQCSSCHKSAAEGGLKKGRELCGQCHEKTLAAIDLSPVMHKAMADSAECLACHSPHVGDTPALLRGSGSSVCLGCHTTISMSDSTVHPPAKEDCANCHTPHGGTNDKLLSEPDIMTLCTSCHEDAVSSHFHPMGDKTKDPKNRGRIVCTSCHSPHNSSQKALLLGEPGRGLCIRCHDPSASHEGGGG